jgi:hypothetical protein
VLEDEEPIVVTVRQTPQDRRRALWSSLGPALWRMRILGVLFLVAAALLILALGETWVWLVGFLFGVVGGGLVVRSFVLPGVIVRRLPPSAFAPGQLEIGRDGIRLSTDNVTVAVAWANLRDAKTKHDRRVLRHRDGGPATDIARRHLSPEQQRQVEALLRERGLLA